MVIQHREPKTVIFPLLKAMRKLSTDYSSLWLIPEASLCYSPVRVKTLASAELASESSESNEKKQSAVRCTDN